MGILVGFWNTNFLDNFMVSKLFKLEKGDAGQKVYANADDKYENFRIPLFSGLRDALCDILPSCLQCCRNSPQDRGLEIGRARLEKETNIIKILQSRRYFSAALK